jgi:hypothetical protein
MHQRDPVSPEMRRRLLTNRHGKLTTDQWLDMVTEPLVVLLVLLPAIILILGPRIAVFSWAFWLAGLSMVAAVFIPAIMRARRYARAPVYFDTLFAGAGVVPFFRMWRPSVLHTASGETLRFSRRLAPHLPLDGNRAYHVYYLRDSGGLILLSIAPADHPEANQWKPSEEFEARFKRRGGRRSE